MARAQAKIRREPDTSFDSQVEAMQAAQLVLLPTRKLEPRAEQIFEMIMSMRPVIMWEPFDLQLATDLAEINARIEWTQEVLAVEGDVLTTRLGTPMINPRATHCGNLRRQAVTLVRALGLSAGQRHLGDEPNRKLAAKQQELQLASWNAEDDPLLA
ncbi:hypothetical protein DM813_23275 [Pseudomonas alkylphenolica]|uniref:Phage terminase small subunit P27 family n=1 Tax=Pseudomonas alkylphenolica TaxID=237609 RepID=A0A443ZK01_9PSED|nr:hypothetical protein [Pseudomonas alkylphenolica]RWU19230.1 hypothetical protein DM813_23275 [Pseudomonas alkylphenolica]